MSDVATIPVATVAVVGHTNAGKTSLMRTLTRQRDFGEISAHPATTRYVELADLAVAGQPVLRLFDTPGFEDSSGLLARIEQLKAGSGEDWVETLRDFAADESLHAGFSQEAKALGQMLASDVLLYVVDARDPVRAKHRDELELLGRCARPVLPVLNFLATGPTSEAEWREQLARVNMHAVVLFDTVAYREGDELALYKKIATLADSLAAPLERLMDQLLAARAALRRSSAVLIAELLVDVAAARRGYPAGDDAAKAEVAAALRDTVRARERTAVADLLRLHRFDELDYGPAELPFAHGAWRQDLFDPQVLEQFGFATTKALAAGATVGLVIDLMTGGLTLGAAALTGAGIGFAVDSAGRYGRQIMAAVRGHAAMTVDEATLKILLARAMALTIALLGRGHAAQIPIAEAQFDAAGALENMAAQIKRARRNRQWSALGDGGARVPSTTQRNAAIQAIANIVEQAVTEPTPTGDST